MRFVDALFKYIKFLNNSSGNLDVLVEGFKPLDVDDNELLEETNRYRQQLKSLYQIISDEIEKDNNEYLEQQRAINKEVWDKCTMKGNLYN